MARYTNVGPQIVQGLATQLRDLKVTDEEVAAALSKAAGKKAAGQMEELFQSLYDSVTHCRSCGHRFKVSGDDRRYQDFDGRTTGRCDECEYEYVTDPDNKWAAIL